MEIYPHGAIPHVEPYRSDKRFLQAVEPAFALLKYNHMRTLLKRGETAESWFPSGTDVITTTTIRDEQLNLVSWDRELERVLEFGPAYHLPTDYSTYEGQTVEERSRNVLLCMEGTLWMQQQLREHGSDTQLIPLVKGTEPEERTICYEVFDRVGLDNYCAFYGTQYFSGGNRIKQLVEDLETIASEQDRDIFLIGLLSSNYLQRVPDSVVAAAGQNAWRKDMAPTKDTDDEIQDQWNTFAESVEEALEMPAREPRKTEVGH